MTPHEKRVSLETPSKLQQAMAILLAGGLVGGWLAGRVWYLAGRLVGWFADLLACRLVRWLAGWLVGWWVGCFAWESDLASASRIPSSPPRNDAWGEVSGGGAW